MNTGSIIHISTGIFDRERQNEHGKCSIVLNMIRYLLFSKWIFEKLLVRQTDIPTQVINGTNVHISKGIFNSENAYLVPNTGPLSEHDHAFDNHDQIFTVFQADFSKIACETDRHTYISDQWD